MNAWAESFPAIERLAALRSRRWAIVAALSITETVSWGILYYAFVVFLVPMERELGFGAAELSGAFSVALLVSAVAGIPVGRYLDRHSPRGLMSLASLTGAALVYAWSQVETLLDLYLVWAAIGAVMAAVLYEPAFTVIAKHFSHAPERRRAMTVLTLVAALASFIFLPLSQALIDANGWRDALVLLAAALALVTVPLHAIVLRPANVRSRAPATFTPAAEAIRGSSFLLLTGAFVMAQVSVLAFAVHSMPFLIDLGYSPGFAALAIGLIGISQIPGRLIFAAVAAARAADPWVVALPFALIGVGIAVVLSWNTTAAIIVGVVVLGAGNGMATLARATVLVDVYGAGAYGAIAGVAGAATTAARAGAPVAGASMVAAMGALGAFWLLAGLGGAAAGLAYVASIRSDANAGWA